MDEEKVVALLLRLQEQLSTLGKDVSAIKEEQQQQQHQLEELKKEQQQQFSALGKDVSAIKEEQQQQQHQLEELKKEQQQQQHQLAELRKEQRQQHLALYSRIGVVFEIAVRSEISKMKGAEFSPSFSITNLYGFARLLRKKETFSLEQPNTTASQHNKDVKKLHDFFYKKKLYNTLLDNILEHAQKYYDFVPNPPRQDESFVEGTRVLRKLMRVLKAKPSSSAPSLSPSSSSSSSSSSSPSSSLPLLLIASTRTSMKDDLFRAGVEDTFTFFDQQAKIDQATSDRGLKKQQEALVSDGFVGFMGFTAEIRNNKLPFHRFLEIDCRGSVSEFLNTIMFEVGEIKSGNDLQKARDQLHYRLSLLFSGARIIHGAIETKGTGYAFFPHSAELPAVPEEMEIRCPFDPSVVSRAKLSVVKI